MTKLVTSQNVQTVSWLLHLHVQESSTVNGVPAQLVSFAKIGSYQDHESCCKIGGMAIMNDVPVGVAPSIAIVPACFT